MNFRFFFASFISHLPYLPFKMRLIRIIYNPDKIFSGLHKQEKKIIKIYEAKFLCNTSSYIDWGIIFFKGHENGLLRFFKNLIKSNKFNLFIDIGANIGYFSIPISYYVNTLSFEPLTYNFEKLKKNSSYNTGKIKLFNFGLSDKVSTSKIYFSSDSPNFGNVSLYPDKYKNLNKYEKIDLKVFDNSFDYSNQNLLIKIDVEGHELNLLRGLKKTLIKNNCFIYIECISEDIINFLKNINYNYFYIKDNLLSKISKSRNFEGHIIAYNYIFYNSLTNFAGEPK